MIGKLYADVLVTVHVRGKELAIAVSETICSERVENEQSIVHKKDVIKSEPDVTGVADEK